MSGSNNVNGHNAHLGVSSATGRTVLAPSERRYISIHGVDLSITDAPDGAIGEIRVVDGLWQVTAFGSGLSAGRARAPFARLLVGGRVEVGSTGADGVLSLEPLDHSHAISDGPTQRPPDQVIARRSVRPIAQADGPAPTTGPEPWVASASPVPAERSEESLDALVLTSPTASVALTLRGLSVVTAGHTRLDGVDLDLGSGEFLAVLGTSGAGKSTLLKAVTGTEPATSGVVEFCGRDLYKEFATLRRRIGYVPQDDILHPQLTIAETMAFASRLRFPADTTDETRQSRIDAVIRELGLVDRIDARVDQLSGGQRKRVNVAVELLTEPDLLILDEPTSGLDPGNERLMMELLRALANSGRMVMVVTHSMESLDMCDSVLFLARGGVPVYVGPPRGLPARFSSQDFTEVFSRIEMLSDPSRLRVPRREITAPAVEPVDRTVASLKDRVMTADMVEIGRQFRILTERYLRVMLGDRRNLLILACQAPVIAVLMFAVFGQDALIPSLSVKAGNVLMAIVLATVYLGASNSVREVVKERNIVRREQNFGLSLAAYLGSKVAVLGALTIVQAALIVVVGTARQGGPVDGTLIPAAKVELVVLVAVCGLSSLCLGLLLSSIVKSADKAMTLLPVALFAQFLLAGLIFPLSALPIQILSWFTTARWGFAGSSATSDFWVQRGCDGLEMDGQCSVLWHHSPAAWLLSYLGLLVLGLACLHLSWAAIMRDDPVEVLANGPSGRRRPIADLVARMRGAKAD